MQQIMKIEKQPNTLASKDLEHIIQGCKKQKRSSQSELYKLYSSKMYGLCLYYAKDYTEAQDVLQDGFIKIFEKIKQYTGKGSFEGWMRRVFVNTALERFRKKKLLFTVDDEDSNVVDNLVHEEIESQINANELLEIIKTISPQYKLVFMLYSIEGFTHKEISDELGISVGTSKSNLARARKILQEKVLAKYSYIPEEIIRAL